MDVPQTKYTKTVDDIHIAYQVVGEGPIDLVHVGWLVNVDQIWRWPLTAAFLRKLASVARLIIFDRRGTGLSDHAIDTRRAMPLDARMDDIRAVMDASGSERAVILGVEFGFALAALFAATYPERTIGLVSYGASARTAWAPDYPYGQSPEEFEEEAAEVERSWGTRELARDWGKDIFPDDIENEEMIDSFAAWMRSGGGPGDVLSWYEVDWETDVRDILPAIRVPTLVIHRAEDRAVPVEHGRYIAEHIPGARLVELPGPVHGWPSGDEFPNAVRAFLAELRREEAELDRVLASVLFTDIVGSTRRMSELGDRQWRQLVEQHHAAVRGMLARYRGLEVVTAGDGVFATFDGPARAVRCATAIVEAVRPLGLEVRAGVHTGEVETINDKIGGIAVAIGARIAGTAGASEVLVSQTVRDLVAGSGLVFEDAGDHDLKGIPDRWRLYRVVG